MRHPDSMEELARRLQEVVSGHDESETVAPYAVQTNEDTQWVEALRQLGAPVVNPLLDTVFPL